jgi:hypothetical protein
MVLVNLCPALLLNIMAVLGERSETITFAIMLKQIYGSPKKSKFVPSIMAVLGERSETITFAIMLKQIYGLLPRIRNYELRIGN